MAQRRRLASGALVVLVIGAVMPAHALAGGAVTRQGGGGAPDVDSEDSILTREQAADFAIKEELAAQVSEMLRGKATGGTSAGKKATSNIVCPDGCGGGGTQPTTIMLETRPRQQAKWFWCGPAVGQVVINFTRGYFAGNLNGENADTNFLKQSTLAGWMGTNDRSGTSGPILANVLNRSDTVLKPVSQWWYAYKDSGTKAELFDKILTDIYVYRMPLVMGVAPHLPNSAFQLASWPNETNAHHYIVLSGYSGLSPATAVITYDDSASGYNGGTGKYTDSFVTIWNVNRNNQAKVIW